MKGFIEIHTLNGEVHLLNIRHIVEVRGNTIYTDDIMSNMTDYPCFTCKESYEEIRDKIAEAAE